MVAVKQTGNNGSLEDGAQHHPFITLTQMVGEGTVEDEGLGKSLSSTTASSQSSLTVCPLTSEPGLSHLMLQQLNTLVRVAALVQAGIKPCLSNSINS